MRQFIVRILFVLLLMAIWAGVVLFTTVSGLLHQPIAKQNTPESFIDAAKNEIDKQFVGNFAMAVIHNGNVEQETFYSAGKPVNRNTVFQVSSLSKWISAVGVMKLVEDGKIDLDAPVSKYLTRWDLPQTEFNNEEVTVRRLLSHTAGLTDGLGYSGFEDGTAVQSLEESLTLAADADDGVSGSVRVGLEPGSEFKYSGGGYTLLQLLVEEVSGRSFDEYMKESIFHPLGMSHSAYEWRDSSNLVLVEFYNDDRTPARHYHYTSQAATSLYTTLSDLEIFFQAHVPGKINEPIGRNVIKQETIRRMREPHCRSMGIDIWGLGTVLFAPIGNNDFIIGHDGKSTPPINTAVRLNPQTGDGIIVLATGNGSIATRLASEWVFWKTGQVDLFLFQMLFEKMKPVIGWGWIAIVTGAIFLVLRKRYGR